MLQENVDVHKQAAVYTYAYMVSKGLRPTHMQNTTGSYDTLERMKYCFSDHACRVHIEVRGHTHSLKSAPIWGITETVLSKL